MHSTALTNMQVRELFGVLDLLEAANVRYAIWSGSQAALLANHRSTQDVDIWVNDSDIAKVLQLFKTADVTILHDRVIVRIGQAGEVECMSRMNIHTEEGIFALRMTDLAQQNRHHTTLLGRAIVCANPADTILLKAILQRGTEVGKHDIADIVAIKRAVPIDASYLLERIEESGAEDRVMDLLCGQIPGLWQRQLFKARSSRVINQQILDPPQYRSLQTVS